MQVVENIMTVEKRNRIDSRQQHWRVSIDGR